MPTKTKRRSVTPETLKKVKTIRGGRLPPVPMSASLSPTVLEGRQPVLSTFNTLRKCVHIYEQETGALPNQVRLIDFIRWWEEREKQ